MARTINGFVGTFATSTDLTTKFPASEYVGCSANVGTTAPYIKYWCDGQTWSGVPATALKTLAGDGIAASASNLTSNTGAAGALTGKYYYTVTFVTALGETAPWPGTGSGASTGLVNPSSQTVDLTAIPIGPAGTIARRIYRTKNATLSTYDPKDYYFLVEISDNTTTTYTDNIADGSLVTPADWAATNRGRITDGNTLLISASDQSTSVGYQAFNTNVGYASTAVGYQALYSNTSGRRNTANGVYALTSLTTGYENVAVGVHAGGGITTGIGNAVYGYAVGGALKPLGNYNSFFGGEIAGSTLNGATVGTQHAALGYRALYKINTADACIGIGSYAGQFANASRQVFIDPVGSLRADITANQNDGLIYGKGETLAKDQDMRINAITRLGPGAAATAIVANLQTPSAALKGYRGWVSDASVAYTSANVGATVGSGKTVVGGGANSIPVFCNGTDWVVG